jgi:hypothetical protein
MCNNIIFKRMTVLPTTSQFNIGYAAMALQYVFNSSATLPPNLRLTLSNVFQFFGKDDLNI